MVGRVFGILNDVLGAVQKELEEYGEALSFASACLLVVVPPAVIFLLLLTDTYLTIIGLHRYGFVEGNPLYKHYEGGVTGTDVFNRFVLATVSAVVFIIVGAAVLCGKRPAWFWCALYVLMWVLMLSEAFVVYNNTVQMVSVEHAVAQKSTVTGVLK